MDSLLAFVILLVLGISSSSTKDVVHRETTSESLCNKTPHPELCTSLIPTETQAAAAKDRTQLLPVRDKVLSFTLAQAQLAHNLVSSMDLSSFNELGKSAWEDCLELYEDTMDLLNCSSSSFRRLDDTQTWLSAAIANIQTCQNGFLDFNLSSSFMIMAKFSESLSNSLAVNKLTSSEALLSNQKAVGRRRLLADGFPEWVLAADRKLLQSSAASTRADIVVAQDGSGNYKTITEAVTALAKRRSGTRRFVIYVKKGVYRENVEIKKSMKNLMLIGDGIDATIVTGNKNVQDGTTTFRSATFAVSGDGFIARGMTFENTAGPQKHQAVALRSGSDLSVFYGCSFKGYQDTLYVYSQRQFYRNCDVYGTVDFIFGDAAAILQNCNIYVRKPMSNQKNTVTAQGRSDINENTGIVIHNSGIKASADFRASVGSVKTYLGRPWRAYSRTIIMKSSLDGLIEPTGWLPWSGTFALKTLYYGEYMNTGAGSVTRARVNWPGYHVITSPIEAGKFSVGNFLAGDSWIPATGVPFTSSV